MYGQNGAHTGHNPAESGVPPLSLAWSASLSTGALHPVVFENGRVFVTARMYTSSANKMIWALDAATGNIQWNYDFGSTSSVGHPSVDGGRVFVQQCNNSPGTNLWSFDAATGALRWSAPFNAQWEDYWSPLIAGNRIYINGGTYGGLYRFDDGGSQVFFASLEQYDEWSPAWHNDTLFTFVAGKLRAHNSDTGAVLWTVTVPWGWSGADMQTPVFSGNKAYVIAPPALYCIDLDAKAPSWSTTGFDYTGAPAVAHGVVYAVSGSTLHARDAATGAWLWSFVGDRKLKYPPVLANNHLYVSSDNNVYAIDLATREQVWTAPAGGWTTIADGRLFTASPTGTLRAYTLSPGTLPWPSAAPPAPAGLSATPASPSRISLSWTDPGGDETSHLVERTTDGVNFSLIAILGAGATGYSDVGLDSSTTYAYRVKAANDFGASAPSNTAFGATPAAGPSWSMFSYDPQHTGQNPAETGSPPLTFAWSTVLSAWALNPVSVEDGRIFVTAETYFGAQTWAWALDAATGVPLWSFDFGNVSAVNPPSVSRGRVFIQMGNHTPDSKIYCFRADTGKPLWASPFTAQWESYYPPTVVGNSVFVNAGYYGGCYGFDARDGRTLFFVDLEQYDEWTPAWKDGTLYTYVAGNLRAHNPGTGATLWTATVTWTWAGWSMNTVAVLGPTHAYILAPPNLHAVNLSTQAVEWSVTGQSFNRTPAYHNGVVYAISGGVLQARSASGLGLLWSFAGDGLLKYAPVFANGYLYVSSDNATYAVHIASQTQVWSAAAGGWLSLSGGRLLIARPNGTLAAYTLTP